MAGEVGQTGLATLIQRRGTDKPLQKAYWLFYFSHSLLASKLAQLAGKIKSSAIAEPFEGVCRRADWIRTSDPYVPNVVRYRAALLPEVRTIHPARRSLRPFLPAGWQEKGEPGSSP